jgi:hypothetical protein
VQAITVYPSPIRKERNTYLTQLELSSSNIYQGEKDNVVLDFKKLPEVELVLDKE